MNTDDELINDGPSFLAIIAEMKIYGGGAIAKGQLRFDRKSSTNYNLVFGRTDPQAHVLDKFGRPVAATNIYIDAHETRGTCWLACTPGTLTYDGSVPVWGETTYLVMDDAPNNSMRIKI